MLYLQELKIVWIKYEVDTLVTVIGAAAMVVKRGDSIIIVNTLTVNLAYVGDNRVKHTRKNNAILSLINFIF